MPAVPECRLARSPRPARPAGGDVAGGASAVAMGGPIVGADGDVRRARCGCLGRTEAPARRSTAAGSACRGRARRRGLRTRSPGATSSSIAATSTSEVNSGRVMPAAASSGMPRFVHDRRRAPHPRSRTPTQRFGHRGGEAGDELGVAVDQLLRGDVHQQRQTRDRRLVGVHDEVAARAHDLRHERVRHPGGVDVAGIELRLRVGEGDLDELDRRGVAAVVLHGLHDRDVTGSAEAVDRDALAGEVLRRGDAGVRRARRPR